MSLDFPPQHTRRPAPPPWSAVTVTPTPVQPLRRATHGRGSWNGFAIAGFVLSLISGIVLGGIFCLVALHQIRRSGERGRELAISGVVLCAAWLIGLGAILGLRVMMSSHRDAAGTVVGGGTEAVGDLRVGDCVATWSAGTKHEVTLTPCSSPHEAEVFYASLAQDDRAGFPGDAALNAEAGRLCTAAATYSLNATAIPRDAQIAYLRPLANGWEAGERTVTCLVTTVSPSTTSLRVGAASASVTA